MVIQIWMLGGCDLEMVMKLLGMKNLGSGFYSEKKNISPFNLANSIYASDLDNDSDIDLFVAGVYLWVKWVACSKNDGVGQT
ncbi:MAG: hypothetical protein IPG07_00120 [Crocinitomicaceae bacterium]|nr:hypothetical protein [Crocinitomicaceae bacterium]